jgi:hypothetical protein
MITYYTANFGSYAEELSGTLLNDAMYCTFEVDDGRCACR